MFVIWYTERSTQFRVHTETYMEKRTMITQKSVTRKAIDRADIAMFYGPTNVYAAEIIRIRDLKTVSVGAFDFEQKIEAGPKYLAMVSSPYADSGYVFDFQSHIVKKSDVVAFRNSLHGLARSLANNEMAWGIHVMTPSRDNMWTVECGQIWNYYDTPRVDLVSPETIRDMMSGFVQWDIPF